MLSNINGKNLCRNTWHEKVEPRKKFNSSYDDARQILQRCITDCFKSGQHIIKMGSITNAITAYKIRETEIKEL